MESFKKYKSFLKIRVHEWRALIKHPRLLIDSYFSGTRNKIDVVIETALQKLDQDAETTKSHQNVDSKQVRFAIYMFSEFGK